ncbi:ABC transporter permease subunit [Pseudoflavitalea sp. G-6-1-2]|uniref:Gldg family protein n=1 Tax=Pseudoflavitalea sp. G-6-1-2 TaxID=2728841 RepID=UPI00146BE025|nr:Gldg family protein [Pseudoflavitalea sp. G-6-1-2]NML21673.1 ABC transporter permease subunit [Pseudoflavitalea sp. G-6-1-2]
MKIVFKIARNELRYLFYSPIAWFVLIVFLVHCGAIYSGAIANFADYQELMRKNSPGFKDTLPLTGQVFVPLFNHVMRNLYIFIPLLTMGLMGREFDSGSAKLLFTSPIKTRQIILGKYIGVATYLLMLVVIVAIFIFTALYNIKNADYGMLFSALLGFYLLVCSYAAIGLFMSSLSNNQIIAAFSTFVVIFILTRIGGLWQQYDLVRDLTYFLSLQNRTWKMLGGLIVSRDLIYFVVVTFMFLAFTLIKVRAEREARSWFVKLGRYAATLAITLTIGYISSRPLLTGYWDTTATQKNTLPAKMQKLLRSFKDSTIEVTLYTNLLGEGLNHGMPISRNTDYMDNFWEPYLRFKPDIKFKYEFYYNAIYSKQDSQFLQGKSMQKIAEETAVAYDLDIRKFKSPDQLNAGIDLRGENYRTCMKITCNGRPLLLRTYRDEFFWPDVPNMTATLLELQGKKMPKVVFISGDLERQAFAKEGERSYSGYTTTRVNRGAMLNIGFVIDTVNLRTHDIPSDADMLVLADPKMDLSETVQGKIRQFVNSGGNMLITGEPGKQYVLNPVLKQLGVQMMNGQLVQPTWDETPDKISPKLTEDGCSLHQSLGSYLQQMKNYPSIEFHRFLWEGTTALNCTSDSGFNIRPMLLTKDNKTWLKQGELVIDSTLPAMNSAAGDLKNTNFLLAAMLSRKINNKEQRIIVGADADFASNRRFSNNAAYIIPMYSWLTGNFTPVFFPKIEPRDTAMRIGSKAAAFQKTFFVYLLPGALLVFGTILLIRRKRK